MYIKYPDLEPVSRLRFEGRELLGNTIYITEKRDGECICIWIDEDDNPHISSRNQEVAAGDIQNRTKATPEYSKIIEMLREQRDQYDKNFIVYAELLKQVSPTRIEPRRKHIHLILFDIYDLSTSRFLGYNLIYQMGYHHKIPVVELYDIITPLSLEELEEYIQSVLKTCRRRRREGVVGKCYQTQDYFKAKVDLPKKQKLHKFDNRPNYPPMPLDRIERALNHAIDQVGVDNWKDKSKALPILARQLETEGREHYFNMPRNVYQIYLESLINDKYRNKEAEKNDI